MSDYPKMLYRDGTARKLWGVMVDTLTVATADEERQARAEGWRGSPLATEVPEDRVEAPAPPSAEAEETIAKLRRQLAEVTAERDELMAQLTAPVPPSEDPIASLRADYERATGKKPFNGWDADTLRAKLAKEPSDAAAG